MAFFVDVNGNITLVQGDSGQLVISGLNTDKDYIVYFAVRNAKRNPIGSEISIHSNTAPSVILEITSTLTDLLTVKANEETAEYYYGIKVCDGEGFEDTIVIGNGDIGDVNTITVYPKKVEGT